MNRASLSLRLGLLVTTCVGLPYLLACNGHSLKRVEYEAAQEDQDGIAITVNKDVDILFVIDNSGSMGQEQQRLSQNFERFIGVLEADDVKANYRLGITTTDNGNYWCRGQGVSNPEAGQFVLSSCRSRLDEFYFSGDDTDASFACTDFCDQDQIQVTQTTTKTDPEAKRRPWLENIEGQTNLPDGITTTEAFQCFGPQGINGCGFESHLESMWKALKLANEESQDEFGFLRDNAILSVVFVTDEADCSFNAAHETEVFGENGSKTFWSLPDDQQSPSSAVCWNAGVECTGTGTFDECHSVNLAPNGDPVEDSAAEEDASLWPLSKYTSFLGELEARKQMVTPGQEVLVAAIAGVPQGYGGEALIYQEGPMGMDENSFQAKFGIAQGCSTVEEDGSTAEAVPPVRLKEFADFFRIGDATEGNNLFSVCDDDYGPALEAIAESIRDQLRPACMRTCVADTDPASPNTVEPSCALEQRARDDNGLTTDTPIPECGGDDALPDGADVCYVALTDKTAATDSTADDMQQACIDEGWNLEFRLVRREGVPAPGGAEVSATCQLSQNKSLDCPDLPN